MLFLAIPSKRGYSFEKNAANDQLTIKRDDGENFKGKITSLDTSGDTVDVMQLDLDGGADNITTDSTGEVKKPLAEMQLAQKYISQVLPIFLITWQKMSMRVVPF